MDKMTFAAEKSDVGKRLDVYLTECLAETDFSIARSSVQKLIENGAVLVNGAVAVKKTPMKAGDITEAELPDPVPLDVRAEDIPLDVLFEDEQVIVINKPQGMVVHPSAGHTSGTVVNALLWRCGGALSGINGVMRPGIVHRIDKDTSGVIVVAKTDTAHRILAAQLAEHSMTRVYQALVNGVMKNDEYTVERPIGRSASDRKKMAVTERNSKPAVTHLRVIERYRRHTLAEARLETGRTHQIRVHAAHIGYPVVGDPLYGRGEAELCGVALKGQMLHARTLGFVSPESGEYVEFQAEMPGYFREVIEKLR